MDLKEYCVQDTYTIKEVLERFEGNNERVAVVLNSQEKVIGIVSQGDILRALSSGANLYIGVSEIVRDSFLHLYEKDLQRAYEIFRKKKITLLPILDREGRLADVIVNNDIYDYLESQRA